MLEELPEDMDGMATTPAAEHLFKVNETPTYLDEKDTMVFHHNIAKTSFPLQTGTPGPSNHSGFSEHPCTTPGS